MKLVIGYGRNKKDWDTIKKLISKYKDTTSNYDITITKNKNELRKEIIDADIFFGHKLGKQLFLKAEKLKWIHLSSAGVDHSLYEENINSDVIITSAKGIHGPYIAEHVLAFLFYFSKSFDKLIQKQKEHTWDKKKIVNEQFLIREKEALILGFGNIGKEIAKELKKYSIKCYGVKNTVGKREIGGVEVLKMKEIDEIIESIDFVIDVLPLTAETENIIDKEFFSKMKKGSIFINVGRGEHVVEKDLLNFTDHLRGIGLDVTPSEPLGEDSELWNLDNVLITQHTSGDFSDYLEVTTELFLRNLERWDEGKNLFNKVNKKKGY